MRLQTALKICCLIPVSILGTSCTVLEHSSTDSKPLFVALKELHESNKSGTPLFGSFNNSDTKTKKITVPTKKTTYTPPAPKTTGTVIRNVRTTAFCHLENEPGAYGNLNAIGTALRYWGPVRSAAADWSRYPLGTQFKIVGQSQIYEIDDFGSALVGNGTIDFYFPTLEQMDNWGLRYVDIEVIKWGSWSKSISYLSPNSKYWHVRQMYHALYAKLN